MRVIQKAIATEQGFIRIHLIADLHIGASNCNLPLFQAYVNKLEKEPDDYVILLGDLLNNAVKSSVSNVYEEVLMPGEQKKRAVELLSPIRDKILTVVGGNHEYRTKKDSDIDLTYDIAAKLDIEDRYQPFLSFLKLKVNDIAYMFGAAHGAGGGNLLGSGISRIDQFAAAIEGVDIFVSGHTHKPVAGTTARLVLDPYNNKVRTKNVMLVTATSWLEYGSYAAKMMLKPTAISPNHVILDANTKQVNTLL